MWVGADTGQKNPKSHEGVMQRAQEGESELLGSLFVL